MAYYNRDNDKLKLNKLKYLNSGEYAKVRYNSDIIFTIAFIFLYI